MEQTQVSAGGRRRTATGLVSGALVAMVAVGALAGCGGGQSGGSSSSSVASGKAASGGGAAERPNVAGGFVGAPQADAAGGTTRQSGAVTTALLQSRRLILNCSVSLTVTDVFATAGRVRAFAAGAGGYVGDEKTFGSGRTASSTLQLRVPQDQLGTVTDQVAALGKVTGRSQTSSDVTEQTVDVQSRIATQKASVARIRALLAQATRISDIVAIEGELSQREADLESLQAQLKSLDDAVQLSTLTVSLNAQGAPKPEKHDTGFLAGLQNGWDAFVTSLVAVLTVLGALLPFAIVLAVLGIPGLLAWRRRRGVRPPAAVPAPEL